ncbi:MAG: hypothetical protein II670_13555 [Alphaproteobacteria bacterium]|nr:hypothetical protein [Alphaproteobacteria bacterium]
MNIAMNKYVIFLFVLFLYIEGHSQIVMNRFFNTSFNNDTECDTINIDKCYITIEGVKIATDTNGLEEIEKMFTIVRIRPLNSHYCMLYVEQTDTIKLVYDSTIVNNLLVALTDTVYSTKLYNVLVKNDEIEDRNEYLVGNTLPLRLRSYFKVIKLSDESKNHGGCDKSATTWTCDQCHIITLHGKEVKIHDCPLYNNLYRLE